MSIPPADHLSRLLRAASVELARLFAPLLRALRRVLANLRAAILLPAHVARLSRLVLAGVRALAGASPSAQTSAGGLAPLPPLPRLLRAVVRAAAGLVSPLESDKQAAWDEARRWTDPRGHRLSARLWRNGQQLRARIDRQVAASVRAGHSPQDAYDRIEGLLIGTPDAPGPGALRRLIVTEATRAHGMSVIAEATRTGGLVRWRLSSAHVGTDDCDRKARANPLGVGPGIYEAGNVPRYPDHPFCRCRLVQVGVRAT